MKNIPVRHHYIPQFVLKRFCYEGNKVWYYDINEKQISSIDISDAFMKRNLYKDKINDYDEMQIERDLAKYETEISKLLAEQFYDEKDIYLTEAEEDKIKLFYAVMAFRSKNASDFFKNTKTKEFIDYYNKYQPDGDFEAMWKRNLGLIVNCRSLKEVVTNPKIDEPFKMFMFRDTEEIAGSYLKIVESEGEEFVLTDCYPLVKTGTNLNGIELILYEYFPISPQRAILVVSNISDYIALDYLQLRKGIFTRPEETDGEKYKYHVKKIKNEEVKMLNESTIPLAKIGVIIRNKK